MALLNTKKGKTITIPLVDELLLKELVRRARRRDMNDSAMLAKLVREEAERQGISVAEAAVSAGYPAEAVLALMVKPTRPSTAPLLEPEGADAGAEKDSRVKHKARPTRTTRTKSGTG